MTVRKVLFAAIMTFDFLVVAYWVRSKILDHYAYSYTSLGVHYSREKTFSNGKTSVTLLGMVHIGEPEFYESVTRDWKDAKVLTLAEGVSDSREKLRNFSYERVAKAAGLTSQPRCMGTSSQEQSDVDTASMSPLTQDSLVKIGSGLDVLADTFEGKPGSLKRLERARLPEVDGSVLQRDILDKRNDYLWDRIQAHLGEDLLVPWGADHLAEIESRLTKRGFKLVSHKERRVMGLIEPLKKVLRGLIKAAAEPK